ncbi:N-6 DNA methylase [Mycolicibacterium iranicum]|uniref:site-specific DNA-methyltransferase (adenine-specific) n=1 Tax=Mycolicibacterium iranicum TaxID=912594 RepID=A0ABT4HRS2_MYCIR|nr:N-6 DNA methylase [Mycolicibacterium iranicum]MCZ0732377.1 ribonuclease H-like domain-containing protein [Mycolicibacterium iranicum]
MAATAVGGARGALMDRLINKSDAVRSEATIQSDVRMLLLDPELGLAERDLNVDLETPAGHGRRIDVEVGCTVIEVKRSLSTPAAITAARQQLTGYVTTRSAEMGQRYVGILTDGRLWLAYHEVDGELREATQIITTPGDVGAEELLGWLEGVLATRRAIRPTPNEIAERLGASSSSHALDYSTLAAIYTDGKDLPTVRLKRELWVKLLRGALGTQFTDSDELFLEHTLLVNSAEIIAHLVLGLRAEDLAPATLLSGDQFAVAGLHGVVDRDFFDWVLEVPGGEGYITSLARRLARFDWSAVEHDVLKVLYESVISAQTRKALGEYYTPDWLANRVVAQTITDPLNQRVLDPSCGSGTFLFYAVRRFLAAADASGVSLADAMTQVSSQVIGIDLHPVAVALARVTYLLALGRDRLNARERGSLSVPVYLGDSLGWDQREDLLTVDYLVIPTDTGDQLLSGELRFADHLLANSASFDDLVQALVDESGRAAGKTTNRLSEGTVRRLALAAADLPALNANFVRLKELHEAGRNHIWSYYIRNAARPAWLGRDENRVDILVGNPPWLSYRYMTAAMQRRFKSLATDRGFWHNETTATHQDLAGLFIARAVERYLKTGGSFAFVVPNSVVDREYWAGFRRGQFDGAHVAFTPSWDLRRIRPHLFPRSSAVVFGTRTAAARPMPTTALVWTGRAPHRHAHVETATQLRQHLGELSVGSEDDERSPYAARFSQGATLVPRTLCRVEPGLTTGLGVPTGRLAVQSKRSATEKQPWKGLPALTGIVESEFVWPTLLGEQIVPFHAQDPEQFVLPLTRAGEMLDGENPKIDAYPGLAAWVRAGEDLWATHGKSKLTLTERFDYMRTLTQQLPIPPIRVVYTKSGMHVAAALITDHASVIDHKLYWTAVSTQAEGHYLVGILNAPSLTELVRPLMSYGKDERDIDKAVWRLPIPTYDTDDPIHTEIAALASELAAQISAMSFRSDNFVTIRRDIRRHLTSSSAGQRLDSLVGALLGVDDDATVPVAAIDLAFPTPTTTRLIRTTDTQSVTVAAVEIDVDCEFDRDGRVYLWGALLSTSTTAPTYYAFGSPSSDFDEHALATQFLSWIAEQLANHDDSTAVWFHYGSTEPRQLRRILGPAADTIVDRAVDVLADTIRPNFYGPAGYSLKQLAPAAGAHWRTPGATGADTYAWIDAARSGDQSAWNTLTGYNEDDVRALRALRAAIAGMRAPGSTLDLAPA